MTSLFKGEKSKLEEDIINITKEDIQSVDSVVDKYNDVNKTYYELLDEYYSFKKIVGNKENKYIRLLIIKEKEIDELKDIVLTLKSDITQFKEICEKKAIDSDIEHQTELKINKKESKQVFNYLKELFDEEIKKQLHNTKSKLKDIKKEKKELEEIIETNKYKRRTNKKKRSKKKRSKKKRSKKK